MTFKFTPRFKRSSRKAGKVTKNPSFTHRMNEMDEWDAAVVRKRDYISGRYEQRRVEFYEKLEGTSGRDQITINQRAPHADSEACVFFWTNIYAGDGDDVITHKHVNQYDPYVGNGSLSKLRVWGGDGRDSFVVEGETNNFIVMDMEVGETITVARKYKQAVEDEIMGGYAGRDTALDGREFFNFEDIYGNDSGRMGVWLDEGTELVRSNGENNMSVFTLVEV